MYAGPALVAGLPQSGGSLHVVSATTITNMSRMCLCDRLDFSMINDTWES